jgi:hypothetical protein
MAQALPRPQGDTAMNRAQCSWATVAVMIILTLLMVETSLWQ